jgi:autotransporter-associated beta strand protein
MKTKLCALLLVGTAVTAASAADRTWTGLGGDSRWANPLNWTDNTAPAGNADFAYFPADTPTPVLVDASTSIRCIYFRNPGMRLTVAAGVNLSFENGGGVTIQAAEDAVIDGDGTLTFSTSSGENYADNQAAAGKILTINAKITGANGFENNGAGTIILASPASDFQGTVINTVAGNVTAFPALSNAGVAGPAGAGSIFRASQPSTFRFTADSGSTDRAFYNGLGAGLDMTLEFTGGGTITLSGPVASSAANAHAVIFDVANAAAAVNLAGTVADGGTAALGLVKRGAGTLLFSGAVSHTGGTVVEQGTLAVAAAVSPGTAALKLRGGTLLLNGGGSPASPYTAALPALHADGGASTVTLAPGTSGANITFAAAADLGGTIDFAIPGLGSAAKVFLSGQPAGLLLWATVNGSADPAYYDAVNGVVPLSAASSLSYQNLAARGPVDAVIENAPGGIVRISSAGTDGDITLAANPTAIAMLSHEVGTPAQIDFTGYSLLASYIQIAPVGADLTLGAAPGDGLLSSASGDLGLANRSTAGAALTVNAAIQDNAGTPPVRLVKTGPGDVVLSGPVAHTGGTAIGDGALVVTHATDITWPSGVISGAGGLRKTGDGTLFLPNAANSYAGTTTVSRGIVSILHSAAFGTAAGPTVIEDGGAVDFIGTGGQSLQLNGEALYAEGTGPDGLGALRNTGAHSQYNAIRLLDLTDDLGIYTLQRLDVRNSGGNGYLNFNGHGIVKKGSNTFGLTQVAATNDQGTAFIDVQEGTFTIEVGTTLSGGDSNRIEVARDAVFDLYNISSPINWSLNLADGARVNTRNGANTNANRYAGPVTLSGSAIFNGGGANLTDVYIGPVSGTGPLVKAGNEESYTYLLGGGKTWTGGTIISNGILYAEAPDSLPDYATAGITAVGRGTLALRVAGSAQDQTGFTLAEINALANNGTTFTVSTSALGLDTVWGDLDFTDPVPAVGISKFGPNTLTLSGAGANIGRIHVYGGTLDLTPASRDIGAESIYVGESTSLTDPLTTLIVGGDAQITNIDLGYGIANQPAVIIGNAGRGLLKVSDNAKVTGKVIVGNAAAAAGAVWQTGGFVHNTGGQNADGRIGMAGYGYYRLDGGSYWNNGYSQIAREFAANGILEQNGGSFVFTNAYNGNYGISRGGTGVVHLAGGTFYSHAAVYVGDPSDNGQSRGDATLTVTGDADVWVNGSVDLARRTDMVAALNLAGGVLNAKSILRLDTAGSTALVNWNGGTFRFWNPDSAQMFNSTVYPDNTVYAGGAVIDLPTNTQSISINTPLRKPQGLGIAAIPVATPGAGYIGAPLVKISGGDGSGASAFAHFDPASGTVTSIEIVSPGSGYTYMPTVTLFGGSPVTAATLDTPVMAFNASGGLTKRGPGSLTLAAPNTFEGPLVIEDGALRLASAAALAPAAPIAVLGGRLDLGGSTITNQHVTVTGSGAIENGSLSLAGLVKDGDGVLDIRASLAYSDAQPPAAPLIPGLWEGMVRSSWDIITPNPRQGIQLTPRAANGGVQAVNTTYAGGLWNGNYHTWIYTGWVWNREDHDVAWTFFCRWDDNVRLIVDGKTLIQNGNGTDVFCTHTLTPGPHSFEVRFGDGTGDVGVGPKDRSPMPANLAGLMVDYAGRGSTDLSLYQQMADPGDGSLFTIDPPAGFLTGPGLTESVIQAAWDTTNTGVVVSRQLSTRAANEAAPAKSNAIYAGGLWTNNNHTFVYTGYLWNREDHDVTWNWRFTFDDNVQLKIDDTLVRYVALGNGVQHQAHTLTPGPHAIEIRFGDGGGSVGPASGLGGLTYDPANTGTTDLSAFILLADPGDGSLLTTDLATGEAFGEALGQPPAPEHPVLTVNGGVVRISAAQPGLWEGYLPGPFNVTDLNPATAIEYTTTAANGWCNENGSVNGKPWPNNSTYVYSGYIWNREGHDVTWTFAKNFDDSVRLTIDGNVLINNSTWSTPVIATVTLTPGAHAFEVRFGQGSGGAAGNASQWWTNRDFSFGVDWQGRGETNQTYYAVPVDPGDGSLFTRNALDSQGAGVLEAAEVRLAAGTVLDLNGESQSVALITGAGTVSNGTLTAGTAISPAGDAAVGTLALENVAFTAGVTYRVTVDGALCDRLTSSGELDLSGVTVVPATDAPVTLSTYVIAHAAGGFSSGKPAVSGFPSKYKVLRKGLDLLLTSQGGSVMILK